MGLFVDLMRAQKSFASAMCNTFIVAVLTVFTVDAQVSNYPWPASPDLKSDKYEVKIREISAAGDAGAWVTPFAFMSKPRNYAVDKHGFAASEFSGNNHNRVGGSAVTAFLEDRSLSFAMFAFAGKIEVEVTKLYGTVATRVNVAPKAFGFAPHFFDGKTVRFYMDRPEYVSVDFESADNRDDDRYGGKDIKNGLMIFADKPESSAGYVIPKTTDAGVVVYGDNVDLATLRNASIIYFPAGEHNLKNHKNNDNSWYYTVAQYDAAKLYRGRLDLGKDGQKVYLAPGAVVHGAFHSDGRKNNWLYGRGIVSGRKHLMHELIRPVDGANGISFVQTTQSKRAFCHYGDGAVYDGVVFLDAFHHTCPSGRNSKIKDIKIIGWSSNNDGVRPAANSTIDHVFIKTSDDYDYARDPHTVSNSVLWPMVNGAIGQMGWSNLGSGYAEYHNNYVINCEWSTAEKGNIGFINGSMSSAGIKLQQNKLEDIYLEGSVNYLVNCAVSKGTEVGFYKDFTFKNIVVEKPFQNTNGTLVKQKMKGLGGTVLENWTFTNLIVNGELITKNNYQTYFDLNLDAQNNDNAKLCKNIVFNSSGTLHSVTYTTNVGGTVSPAGKNGKITAIGGTKQTISIVPAAGKKIVNVKVDGVDKGRIQTVVFDNIAADHTIAVEFGTGNDYYDLSPVAPAVSNITTFTYPVGTGEAFLSTQYDVYVKDGDNPEQKLQVLMSDVNYRTMYDGDWMKEENKNRTFSFVNLDNHKTGKGLTFRIVKKFGNNSASVKIAPRSYGYTPTMNGGKEVTFTMNEDSKYISINFEGTDNQTGSKKWIRHMLCIFVDPKEANKPAKGGSGVVEYSNTASATALSNASVIYFPAGYHNLRNYTNGGLVNSDGVITIKSNQSIYLEGGAFVEGIIKRTAYGDVNQKIYGRGIWTGRQYYWKNHPSHSGPEYGQLIEIGNNATVQGIMYMESPNHGLVGRNVAVDNVKFLGWHSNHDGIRVGEGSVIRNTFSRAVDDHFYNFGITVQNCVLWAGHNGSILTYGWGGDYKKDANGNILYDANGQPIRALAYNAGGSLLENIDIINPEWVGLGNNQGIVMAQTGLDFQPHDYGNGKLTIVRNIRIEGTIPALTNLKPRSANDGVSVAVQIPIAELGYLGDLLLENITIDAQFDKGRIRGAVDAAYDGTATYFAQNIELKNVTIGGVCITEANKSQYFNIDAATTKDIRFVGCGTVVPNTPPTVSLTSPLANATFTAPATITISANAADADGTIAKVEFYNGTTLLNTDNSAPYSYSWTGVATGTYSITAKAYDDKAAVTTSTAVSITVTAPVVTIPNITDLTATATDCNSVQLTWGDVAGEEAYRVRRMIVGGTYEIITDVPANTTSYTDATAVENTEYIYMVRPMKGGVAVAISNTPTVQTPVCVVTVPDITDLSATAKDCKTVELTWSDVAGADGYAINRTIAGGTFAKIADVPANTNTYTDAAAEGNTEYEYMVLPMQAGAAVATSNTTPVETPVCIVIIPNITDLTATTTDCNSVQLTWSDVAGEEAYRVRRMIVGGTYEIIKDLPANSTTYVDATAKENTEYIYMVRPMKGGVAVALSNTPTGQTPYCIVTIPDIADLTATATACNTVQLAWSDVAGEEGYEVHRTIARGTSVIVADLPANATTYTDVTATENTEYIYMVRPMRAGVAAASSNTPTATTEICIVAQTIELQAGWNLISTNVHPTDSTIASLFGNIDVQEIKTMNDFWRKGQADMFNSLQTITAGNGYLVKMNVAGELKITGTPFNIQNPTPNIKNGWNLIGCPYPAAVPFSSIFNSANCKVIKDFEGFWLPSETINSIYDFEIGKAYLILK
jgi:fibronectin type 3 domain-containing protein